ncbi:hypothetical protein D9613_009562 [Agrocybe pediades]|uniref:Uncharacterized protein n=1 Tax=Agrocybe pediades TaxID=84607 RepID=A0A8H4R5A7_9AGAR|nr:hypothetical protein D9613_009562 [Agrocybe pediades]
MATIRKSRIATSFKYHTAQAIPEFSLERLEWSGSDDDLKSVVSHSSISSRGRNEATKIPLTEGCFVTKQTGYYLEKAHWVNPVRKNAQLKYEVELLLKGLHIVPPNFNLNSTSNLAPLDRNLHYTLDKLGFFAVTCSIATLRDMISLVEKENKIWQANNGVYPRRLILEDLELLNASYEFVLLHPRHFLQHNGSGLPVYTRVENGVSGKFYFASPDGALRAGPDNDQDLLPPFATEGRPEGVALLNPFLVVIHAGIAFRRFKKLSLPPLCKHYEELIKLTLDLVEKIYFEPILDIVDENRAAYRRSVYVKYSDGDVAMTGRNSRTGTVVKRPGPDASHEERVGYSLYLMSGCDYINDDDEEDEEEDEEEEDEDYDEYDDGDDGDEHENGKKDS